MDGAGAACGAVVLNFACSVYWVCEAGLRCGLTLVTTHSWRVKDGYWAVLTPWTRRSQKRDLGHPDCWSCQRWADRQSSVMSTPGVTGMAVSSVRGVGPGPDRAYVYMHELALGIVANPAGVEGQGCVAYDRGWDAVDAEVNGLGDDVLGVLGGVCCSAGAEFVVGLLGAVAGEHVDRSVGFTELGEHGVQQVEGAWIVLIHLFVVRVAEEIIQLVERFRNVRVADTVDNVEHIAGVAVRQFDLIFFAVFRQRVFVLGENSDFGQGHVHEGMGEGV